MATKQIFNARTQAVEDVDLQVDNNNEIVGTFADGSIVKFPAGISTEELDRLIEQHEADNTGQEVITPETEAAAAAERAASLAAIGESAEVPAEAPADAGASVADAETPAEDDSEQGEQIDVKVNTADTTASEEQSNAPADSPAESDGDADDGGQNPVS